jgi:hypothetical protein
MPRKLMSVRHRAALASDASTTASATATSGRRATAAAGAAATQATAPFASCVRTGNEFTAGIFAGTCCRPAAPARSHELVGSVRGARGATVLAGMSATTARAAAARDGRPCRTPPSHHERGACMVPRTRCKLPRGTSNVVRKFRGWRCGGKFLNE